LSPPAEFLASSATLAGADAPPEAVRGRGVGGADSGSFDVGS